MEIEEALEHPDISSQDSPMKTFTSELNTLKRHFPTVKSVNGESPGVNNADIATVVNTIKAVSAACQAKDLEEHKINSETDAISERLTDTSSVEESNEENKVNGNEQTSEHEGEPENKRIKVSIENTGNDIQHKADEKESKEFPDSGNNSFPDSNDNLSIEPEISDNDPVSERMVGSCSIGNSNACPNKEDCDCGEESELRLRIEASPEKEDENQSSDLENRKKPENCFTPIKNHQCLSEEARKSPFLIGDKIRNSLKGIVEKVKSSPDHKRNSCSPYTDYKDDKLQDQEEGYYRSEKVIAQGM